MEKGTWRVSWISTEAGGVSVFKTTGCCTIINRDLKKNIVYMYILPVVNGRLFFDGGFLARTGVDCAVGGVCVCVCCLMWLECVLYFLV